VLFPALARVTRANGSVSDALLRSVRALAAVIAPLGVGIALVAPDLVAVLFGERWAPAIPVMRWLAAFSVLSTLLYTDDDVYKALGRPSVMIGVTFTQLVLSAPLLWWAAGSGIEAIAMAQCAVALAILALRVGLARVLLGVPVRSLVAAVTPVAIGVGALAGAVGLVQALLAGTPSPVRLLASVLVGGAAYLAALAIADRRWLADTVRLFGRGQRAPGPVTSRGAVSVP
jgi:PST family polysaccharide transporter